MEKLKPRFPFPRFMFVVWLAVGLLLANITTPASAQLIRALPQDARFGELQDLDYPFVKISGKVLRLSPGAKIRDRDNRIVQPNELNEGGKIAFLLDPTGELWGIWLLTSDEIAELVPPKSNSIWPW